MIKSWNWLSNFVSSLLFRTKTKRTESTKERKNYLKTLWFSHNLEVYLQIQTELSCKTIEDDSESYGVSLS